MRASQFFSTVVHHYFFLSAFAELLSFCPPVVWMLLGGNEAVASAVDITSNAADESKSVFFDRCSPLLLFERLCRTIELLPAGRVDAARWERGRGVRRRHHIERGGREQ